MTLRSVALGLLVVVLAGCTGDASQPPGSTPSPAGAAPSGDLASPLATPSEDGLPELAEAPGGDAALWVNTIGAPVVAAVRTSTPLARLRVVAPDEREATCQQVAADLDTIAAPQELSGLAITADAETATLLVGDLRAKGDLLAACTAGGDELEAHIAEVERTHAVAVAWLAVLGGDA